MPRSTQTKKEDKAKYDKERKAIQRKERRFAKPFKLFMYRKYPAQYGEFVTFFNLLENTYPGKKDLTKTEMFRKFMSDHSAQETEQYPVMASLLEPNTSPTEPFPNTSTIQAVSTSFTQNPNTAASLLEPNTSPTEPFPNTSTIQAVSTSFTQNPNTSTTQTTSTSFTQNAEHNIISELVDELFGSGDLDRYIEHVENADEGIDVNILDELKLDLEPFNFELEALDF